MSEKLSRRRVLRGGLAFVAVPYFVPGSALGAGGRPAASERIVMAAIGMGTRGPHVFGNFAALAEVQAVAVCDVMQSRREAGKQMIDARYGNRNCAAVNDFREILSRADIDAVVIATPEHWHALMTIEACRQGKDVFCEKPESQTIRQGRAMVTAARRYNRVVSGGSQRVWEDYNWFHRMVRGEAIGRLQEVWVSVGGPPQVCALPEEPVPQGLDWDLWLGPAPWAPYNRGRLNFRAWRDYSGGGLTDWGAHGFGGALFAANLHRTGPAEIIPPDFSDNKLLTFKFANGVRMYHGGNKGWTLAFKGTEAEIGKRDMRQPAPNVLIPNYKGRGGLPGDFLYCVRHRQRPFRDIELGHRTVSVCHLGNIAYWLNRPLKWDPVKEEFIGDDEANRWLDRPVAPWHLS